MAQFGAPAENFDAQSAYMQTFGTLPNKYTYSDPLGLKSGIAIDLKTEDHILTRAYNVGLKAQATTSGGAGTAGYAMIPVFVDPRVIDRSRKYTPLVELFPRVTNNGMYADYNVIVSKGGAFFAAEDGPLSETNTTYDRASTQIKFMYAVGRVTGPSVAAQPSYILAGMMPAGGASQGQPWSDAGANNALQQEVLVKTRELKELEEDTLINGNSSSNALKFDGFIQLLGSTNAVAKSTTALSLDDITTSIQYAFDDGGRPNVGVCGSAVFGDLLNLLTAKIGFLQSAQVAQWGFSYITLNTMVGPVMVVPSMYMSNVSGSKAIYFLDMTVVEVRVLQDTTYEDLAKTNDSRKFMLKQYECLIIKANDFNSSITGIA